MMRNGNVVALRAWGAGAKKLENWVFGRSSTGQFSFTDGGTPGSPFLCELTRDFHPGLSLSCEAKDSQPREGLSPRIADEVLPLARVPHRHSRRRRGRRCTKW